MQAQLKKVEGGYQVLIPDELAGAAGLGEGTPAEIRVFADRIEIWSPEHVRTVYQQMIDSITPENRHEEVGFGRPVGKEKFWEDE